MNEVTFRRYLDAYNRGDYAAVNAYYTDDIVFESYGQRRVGPDVRQFLEHLHRSVKDRIILQRIEIDGDRILLEADTEITAIVDAPNLPFGPMQAGASRIVSMQVVYETQGEKIRSVKVM